MLGLTREEILNAVSLAWVDGQSLRTYRHAPNTGTRKSWAAGDATSRAVRLALMAKTGETVCRVIERSFFVDDANTGFVGANGHFFDIRRRFACCLHLFIERHLANAITLEFTDGTRFEEVVVEYPIGHARRRQDGIPKLVDKFKINLARQFPTRQQQRILEVSLDRTRLEQMPVNEYLDLYVI